ncbi:GTPase HflX [candidate division KSB1 bacterium]
MMLETRTEKEKVIIVGVVLNNNSEETYDTLNELERLVNTAGGVVVAKVIQERKKIDPAYYIGKGKAEFVKQMCGMEYAGTVIFDEELSPAQVKNLEKIINKKVIDRSGLILDIFANNARTKEAKTQVELAQLNYLLPRLTRRWTHLERQDGAIGLRGPGETQLETDKRLINNRIKKLKKELAKIETQRNTRRKSRSEMFRASLIGYTNSGKSTTMNLLTDASVLVENKLFATLDSTIKKLTFSDKSTLLLSDTVGFIKKLPHQLIASFKSTLEEVRESDILIHVIDISHKNFREQIDTVNSVLHELQINDKLTINVFNKIDLLNDELKIKNVKEEFPEGVFISAKLGLGIQNLINSVHEILSEQYFEGEFILPDNFNEDISKIYKVCDTVDIIRRKKCTKIKYRVRKELKDSILNELKKITTEETVNCF